MKEMETGKESAMKNKFEPIWSSLDQFEQVWTNLNKFEPICNLKNYGLEFSWQEKAIHWMCVGGSAIEH